MQEPTNRKGSSGISVVVKVLAGLVAFFGLLLVAFVFFIAVVCGK